MVLQRQLCADDYRALRVLGCDVERQTLRECAECLDEFAAEVHGQKLCVACQLNAQMEGRALPIGGVR